MNLSFKVFGHEIWSLDLQTPDKPQPANQTVFRVRSLDDATKAISRQWVKRMMR